MTIQEVHRRLLVFSSGAKDEDELGSWLIDIHGCFASVAKDDNKPFDSFPFFAFLPSSAKENDESGGSLSSPCFFPQVQKTLVILL